MNKTKRNGKYDQITHLILHAGDDRVGYSDKMGSHIVLEDTEVYLSNLPYDDVFVIVPGFDTLTHKSGFKYTFHLKRENKDKYIVIEDGAVHCFKGSANPYLVHCKNMHGEIFIPKDLVLHAKAEYTGCSLM